ncbi:hypothetical protein [Thermomonospora umbrina]|uniref:hypothetical protein n=1 Tax=Thermomonospora umbrina TaxID=111806 RepID=UPI0014771431|nr:hypothetical protein [Thermomonospora umbrina]
MARRRGRPAGRRVSGYVGWVLAAWLVSGAVGAGIVLWPGGDGDGGDPGRAAASPEGPGVSRGPAGSGPATRERYWVDTFAAAEGYREPDTAGSPVGSLRRGTHYVFCKRRGARVERGDQFNHWWLLTDLDEVYGGGGPRAWVSALYLAHWGDDEAKDNDGRDIPVCPS